MTDIREWYQPQITTEEIFEGIYPSVILNCVAEEVEDKDKKKRKVIKVTFETLHALGTPLNRDDHKKIVFEARFYFDVQMHRNALNRLAYACDLSDFRKTEEFEGKTLMAGVINNKYTNSAGKEKTVAQAGYGCFSYAPMPATGAKPEFIINDYKEPTEENKKAWFQEKIKNYYPVR